MVIWTPWAQWAGEMLHLGSRMSLEGLCVKVLDPSWCCCWEVVENVSSGRKLGHWGSLREIGTRPCFSLFCSLATKSGQLLMLHALIMMYCPPRAPISDQGLKRLEVWAKINLFSFKKRKKGYLSGCDKYLGYLSHPELTDTQAFQWRC
jgi:hypothetical protein